MRKCSDNAMPEEIEVADDRFHKIEEKLDKVEEALVTLARMDERMITLFKNTEKMMDEMKTLSSRVATLEKHTVSTGVWGYIGDKLLWIVIGGFVAVAVKLGFDK